MWKKIAVLLFLIGHTANAHVFLDAWGLEDTDIEDIGCQGYFFDGYHDGFMFDSVAYFSFAQTSWAHIDLVLNGKLRLYSSDFIAKNVTTLPLDDYCGDRCNPSDPDFLLGDLKNATIDDIVLAADNLGTDFVILIRDDENLSFKQRSDYFWNKRIPDIDKFLESPDPPFFLSISSVDGQGKPFSVHFNSICEG